MDETPMGPPGTPTPAPPMTPAPAPQTGRPGPANDTSKLLAALGYVIWPVALIAILMEPYKDEPFVKFHGFQALGFGIAISVISIIAWAIPFVDILAGPLVSLLWLIVAIMWAIKAYNGEYAEMPVVYGFVKNYVG